MYVRNPLPKGVEGVRKKSRDGERIEGGARHQWLQPMEAHERGTKDMKTTGQLEVQEVAKRLCTGNVHGWFTTTHHSLFLDTEGLRFLRLAPAPRKRS